MTTLPTRPAHLRTFAVVNYLLDLDRQRRSAPGAGPHCYVDVEELHTLVYLAHGFQLASMGEREPLILEPIHASECGPRIASLDREFSRFQAAEPVTRYALTFWDEGDEGVYFLGKNPLAPRLLPDSAWPFPGRANHTIKLLDAVWETYHGSNVDRIEQLLTGADSPWARVNAAYNGRLPDDAVVPNGLIREQFTLFACLASLLSGSKEPS